MYLEHQTHASGWESLWHSCIYYKQPIDKFACRSYNTMLYRNLKCKHTMLKGISLSELVNRCMSTFEWRCYKRDKSLFIIKHFFFHPICLTLSLALSMCCLRCGFETVDINILLFDLSIYFHIFVRWRPCRNHIYYFFPPHAYTHIIATLNHTVHTRTPQPTQESKVKESKCSGFVDFPY